MNALGPEKLFDSKPATDPTVFVVDDDLAFCDALKWLIESDGLVAETHFSPEAFFDAFTDFVLAPYIDVKFIAGIGAEITDPNLQTIASGSAVFLRSKKPGDDSATLTGDGKSDENNLPASRADCICKDFDRAELIHPGFVRYFF